MEIIIFVLFIIIILFMLFVLCSCILSSRISRIEDEAYIPKHLDPKDLDDEIKWEDSLVYDDEFVRKEDKQNEFNR